MPTPMKYDTKVRAGEHLIFEVHPALSRTTGTLLAGKKYVTATVLGMITASKKLVEWDPAASDGSQNVAGVLYDERDATSADAKCVYNKALSVMMPSKLSWKAGLTDANKAAGLAQLDAKHISMSAELGD